MDYRSEIRNRGLKISWLAKMLGMAQPTLSLKINGERKFTEFEEKNLNQLLGKMSTEAVHEKELNLPDPNCQLAEAAYLLLKFDSVTRKFAMDNAWIMNFPEAVRKLRERGADISTFQVSTNNRYGRPISFGRYKSMDNQKLREIYLKILGDNEKTGG